VTNRDKKDSVRGRMADAGEPFNVARRKVEAAGCIFAWLAIRSHGLFLSYMAEDRSPCFLSS
jgi:hypothetical protein